jgi:hypothetical protein
LPYSQRRTAYMGDYTPGLRTWWASRLPRLVLPHFISGRPFPSLPRNPTQFHQYHPRGDSPFHSPAIPGLPTSAIRGPDTLRPSERRSDNRPQSPTATRLYCTTLPLLTYFILYSARALETQVRRARDWQPRARSHGRRVAFRGIGSDVLRHRHHIYLVTV